jgi:hypothetical protein
MALKWLPSSPKRATSTTAKRNQRKNMRRSSNTNIIVTVQAPFSCTRYHLLGKHHYDQDNKGTWKQLKLNAL